MNLVLYLYFIILVILSVFGFHRYYLVYLHRRYRGMAPKELFFDDLTHVPTVTVQLPIFNERYVLERLLESVAQLDYPRDKLEIQVLDDSTDETAVFSQRLVEEYQRQGLQMEWIHRVNRVGFKAGALNDGLKIAKGEFIAVFDADFVPDPDFLKKVVPQFASDQKLGMVQARWGHLNRDFSMLTQTQAIFLDGHFVIEHAARNRSGLFFNFNGTAGVWRRACIEDTGGWSAETVTEDLHLSYRAQMKGWQFRFLNDVVVPAELPVEINAFRSQQHRWAKGSIQTALKLLPEIMRRPFPLRIKVEAFFHLCSNFAYLLMFIISVLMPFTIYARHQLGWDTLLVLDIPLFLGATFSIVTFYLYSQKEAEGKGWLTRLKFIPLNFALGIGLCVNNSWAVIDALLHEGGDFTRTPKYAVHKKGDSWVDKKYRVHWNWLNLVELALAAHLTGGLYYVLLHRLYFALPYVLLFQVAFLYMGWSSLHSFFRGSRLVPSLQV